MAFPSLNILRTFEAAARLGSFNKAAEELHVSPSAVSHQIRQLEDILGVKLFHRAERRVVLSEKGDYYFKNVQQGIQILVQATNSLMDPTRGRTIRMSVVPFFATRWLMKRLETFQSQHPNWELAIQTSTQKSDFEREDLDLVIRRGGGEWDELSSHLLLEEKLITVATPDIAAKVKNLDDLKQAKLLFNAQVPSEWSEWFDALEQDYQAPKARLEFQNNSQILDACQSGIGIALMDEQLVSDDLASGRVVPVLPDHVSGMRNYFLVHPQSYAKRQAVQIFLAWIREELKA